MEVISNNKDLRKALADHRQAVRIFGSRMADLIERRVAVLQALDRLGDLWPPNSGPERCHELIGDRKGTFSMNLQQPYRLIFRPISKKPKEAHENDKAWWNDIEAVELVAVEDTHE